MEASNATLYCSISHQGVQAACVYKPVAGERPLWDFPPRTLAGREVAAYAVSRAAGWGIVPPTVMRDGPFGPGMCQLWINADAATDLIALARSCDHPQLRDMAVFDAVVNNADRKIGHLLPLPGGRLYGCDHGVCFAEEYKLRTVLWQWRGRRLPGRAMQALAGCRRRWPATTWRRTGSAAVAGRGAGDQRPDRPAGPAPRAPLPAGELAGGALAAGLAARAGQRPPRSPGSRRRRR